MSQDTTLVHPKYRADIDGLRAVAVLLVVGFHAFPYRLKGGFVGVDIFFVISGYLISMIIFGSLERSSFSFIEFYSRRIRRIFPALMIVLLASFLIGWFVLLRDEFSQLGEHIAGGASFISNFILKQENGYFDNAVDKKPLMHLWSLGVEEQFYILFPFLLWSAWKAKINLFKATALIAIISFGLNLFETTRSPNSAFYYPQTRFWELMCGAFLAHAQLFGFRNWRLDQNLRKRILNSFSVFGIILILISALTFGKEIQFPGWRAIFPVFGGAFLIFAGSASWLNSKVLSHRLLVWIGKISYPLYLWHWILLCFARIIECAVPSVEIRVLCVGLSFLLAYLTCKFVEGPLRAEAKAHVKSVLLILILALIGGLGYWSYSEFGIGFRSFAKANQGISNSLNWYPNWNDEECSDKYHISPCQVTQGKPIEVMIIGDSHGNHLFPGLANNLDSGVISFGTCSPFVDVVLASRIVRIDGNCAMKLQINQSLEILRNMETVKTVIVSTYLRYILNGEVDRKLGMDTYLKSLREDEVDLSSQELAARGLERTLQKIFELRKRVILVRDTPDLSVDFRDRCLGRSLLIDRSPLPDCTISRNSFELGRQRESLLLQRLNKKFPELIIFDPVDNFCDKEKCYFVKNGELLYRDRHHLSLPGSELIGKSISAQLFKK